MASHGQGESVCLPAWLPPPPFFLLPSSISPHNLSPPSCIWLESPSSRACLGFNKSLYREQVGGWWGGWGFMCVPASHLQTWSPQKTRPTEYVLLEGFCPFPVWIGKCAAWQNGLLSAKRAIPPTGLGRVINVYTFDCHLGVRGKNWLFIWATLI